jgi:catechol 2,3-dioxygenase
MSNIDTGLALGGAKLPFETYFTYGTPSKLTLTDHIVQFSNPPAPPAQEAAESVPDAIEHSPQVSGAPTA